MMSRQNNRNAKIILIVLAAFIAYIFAEKLEENGISIHGMQRLKIKCDTETKLKQIYDCIHKTGFDFITLTKTLDEPVEILVSADQVQDFKSNLSNNYIEYEVIDKDVGKILEKEISEQKNKRIKRSTSTDILDSFPRYDDMKKYLKNLANTHKNKVIYSSIGTSFENRNIPMVKITSDGKKNKPAIVIDAGIHAREWIAPTTALYVIQQLVENATNSFVFKNVDIYVIPLLNPDGYEFSHKSAETRLWRKTRSINNNSKCIGVDANRNFDFEWNVIGTSNNPCSYRYGGRKPFSEPETRALKKFLLNLKNFRVYLSFHSAASFILYPWGHTSQYLPPNVDELHCVAEKAASAIRKNRGTPYKVGNSATALYPAAGGSDDWALAKANASLSYTIELPSLAYNFTAPTSEIKPVGQETFEAVKVFAKYAELGSCEKI